MLGTSLVETLVQCATISHRIARYQRIGLLLLAAPESGKTSIVTSQAAKHVMPIAVITGRSVEVVIEQNPEVEFLAFNDLTCIRALSYEAHMLLVTILNQVTQDERGTIAFAGQRATEIKRPLGVIACIPFDTFKDHRARWKEIGFISRLLPFAYSYPDSLVAKIKDQIDTPPPKSSKRPRPKAVRKHPIVIACPNKYRDAVRILADERAAKLGQIGLRLLKTYHCLIRAHALHAGRRTVIAADLRFLEDVDRHVSISECQPLLKK